MYYSCNAKGLHLKSKRTTLEEQKDSFFYKMKHFASCDDCSFVQQSPQLIMYQQHIAARSKLENFEPKICLCVQQAVLSDENANIITLNSQFSILNSQFSILN